MLLNIQKALALAILFLVLGFCFGWAVNGWRKDAEIGAINAEYAVAVEAHVAAVRAREDAVVAAQQVEAELAVERERKNKIKERVITNDVIKYVQTPGAYKCGLDAAGVRLLNRAASGSDLPLNTDPPGVSDAEAGTATIVVRGG